MNKASSGRGLELGYLLGVAAFTAATVGATLSSFGTGEEGLKLANRYLARLAFYLFLPAFSASALHRLRPSDATRWMLRERRSLGLGYAIAQFTHLAMIFASIARSAEPLHVDVSMVVGGSGFLILLAMTLTSNDAARRALGAQRWMLLHRIGINFLWTIYGLTYLGNVFEDGSGWGWAGLLLALGAMLLKVIALRTDGRTRVQRGGAEA